MTLELPHFRLGLAGFSAGQQDELRRSLAKVAAGSTVWEVASLEHADAWWVNGVRVRLMGGGFVRVEPGEPGARAIQLHLPDVDRPMACSTPLECGSFKPLHTFDPTQRGSIEAVLETFDGLLSAEAAQFCLASHIVEHQAAMGSGIFELTLNGMLLALVDMHGAAAVLPGTSPADFDDGVWRRLSGPVGVPEHLASASLSQLMWQYAVRTRRDVLPAHYRTGLLYYRRPPRVPQRLVSDSHLLLMRELAAHPSTFEVLGQRTGLAPDELARDLAALYWVGTITSNPRRAVAGQRPVRVHDPEPAVGPQSSLPSALNSDLPAPDLGRGHRHSDMTVPAPLWP